MGTTAKSRFYSDLQKNYREEKDRSDIFLFLWDSYLPPEDGQPDDPPAKGRARGRETYVSRLWEHYRRLQKGQEGTTEYAGHLLSILRDRKVLYQSRYESTSPDGPVAGPTELLARLVETGLGLTGDEGRAKLRKKNRLHRSLEELVRLMEAGDEAVLSRMAASGGELKALTEAVLNSAIHLAVRQFFYDAGYPYRDDNGPESGDGPQDGEELRGRKIQQGHEDSNVLRLLYQHYDGAIGNRGCATASAGGRPEPTAQECQQLYDYLSKGDNGRILVPLRVDPTTGCALYIVGKSYYKLPDEAPGDRLVRRRAAPPTRSQRAQPSCFFGIMRLWELNHDELDDNYGGIGLIACDRYDDFPNAREALKYYEAYCKDTLEDIWDYGVDRLPQEYLSRFWPLGGLRQPAGDPAKERETVYKEDNAARPDFKRLGCDAAFGR